MLQPIYERVKTPNAVTGESFVKVIDSAWRQISIRTQCMGPSFTDSGPMTDTVVLLEVGGGSAGIDLIGI